MADPFWELSLALPDSVADDAGALFVSEGALGCEHVAADMPLPVFPGESTASADRRPPAAPGETLLVVSFAGRLERLEVEGIATMVCGALGLRAPERPDLVRRTDAGWAERWKEHFRPLCIGRRVWIVPSWERGFRPPAGAVVVTLDPGLAFGTGQHATTALCLGILEALTDETPTRRGNLLDVGCGSGVLAVAGALLGCTEALAIDSDPVAVTVAQENIAQNGVAGVARASVEPLAAVTGTYRWVLANIITPVLVELAGELVRRTAPGGALVLSGILAGQEDEVMSAVGRATVALERARPRLVEERRREEWVALWLEL